jgi:hypothetical protein
MPIFARHHPVSVAQLLIATLLVLPENPSTK